MPKKGGGGGGIAGSWSKDRPEGSTIAIKDTGLGLLDNWAWLESALSIAMSFPGTAVNRGWPKIPGRFSAAGRALIASPSDGMWIARDLDKFEYWEEASGAWVPLYCAMIGEIRTVAFDPSSPPLGWLECNGAAVSESTYADLFAVIGYGFGNPGGGNFNLPDMRGRIAVGLDKSGSPDADFDAVGDSGGAKTHTLAVGELPTHSHTVASSGAHTHKGAIQTAGSIITGGTQPATVKTRVINTAQYSADHTHAVDDSGETRGSAHENRMKYIVVGSIVYAGT
jgi:microcystin-dependent protein